MVLAVRRNSPCSGRSLDFQRHRLRQVALGHGADDAGRFAGRMDQVVDQIVDGVDGVRPRSR